jgi:hypothetical protein
MATKNTTKTAAPTVTLSVEDLQAMIAAAVAAALPQKKTKVVKEAPKRPEGLPLEPSSFKVPNGGPFGIYVPDGFAGINKTTPPPTDQAIAVNKRDREQMGDDGLCVITETRYYVAGGKGWKRAKKDGGWVSYFPKRVEVETEADDDFDAAMG